MTKKPKQPWVISETGPHIAQAEAEDDLELPTLSTSSPKCRDDGHAPPCSFCVVLEA